MISSPEWLWFQKYSQCLALHEMLWLAVILFNKASWLALPDPVLIFQTVLSVRDGTARQVAGRLIRPVSDSKLEFFCFWYIINYDPWTLCSTNTVCHVVGSGGPHTAVKHTLLRLHSPPLTFTRTLSLSFSLHHSHPHTADTLSLSIRPFIFSSLFPSSALRGSHVDAASRYDWSVDVLKSPW